MVQISIITPVYNSVQFIESCINNVIDQKCPQAEHIIIDGGSTDGTLEIIKNYATRYSHIRWVSEKDKGQSDAMNKGIKMAKGEILGFLNADDGYLAFTLIRILTIFNKITKSPFIVGNCKFLDENRDLIYINRPKRIKHYHLYSNKEPFPINPVAYFYKKSIHDTIGFYTIDNHFNMDYEFIMKSCLLFDMVYFNEEWGYVVSHEGAKTLIDTQNNELQARKQAIYKQLYQQCPIKIKILANIYKLLFLFIKK